jgi:hypothetical protein
MWIYRFLSDIVEVVDFTLISLQYISDNNKVCSKRIGVELKKSGILHAIAIWFKCELYNSININYILILKFAIF